jgi:hypothetical protein
MYKRKQNMSIEEVIKEWKSKKRRMGCVKAADFFCSRVSTFFPLRLTRFNSNGELYQHVVATDGNIIIDIAPYTDRSKSS